MTSSMREAFFEAPDGYNQPEEPGDVELRSPSAPVFGSDGRVAYMLTMWGRWERVTSDKVCERVDALCHSGSRDPGGQRPMIRVAQIENIGRDLWASAMSRVPGPGRSYRRIDPSNARTQSSTTRSTSR